MSGLHENVVCAGMDTTMPSSRDAFERLRGGFHRLSALDAASRDAELRLIEAESSTLATQLRDLLAHLDESDLIATPEPDQPDRIGPFRVIRRIGRGGMGEVFLAHRVDSGFEQTVAIKRIRETAMSAETLRRFQRERAILARLQHPNIARLVDGGVDADGRPWLAMEYVEGSSLASYADAHHLDIDGRVAMVRKVCAAVMYAHRNLVVHRDLKPSNVLVTTQGEPMLLDFGIAKVLDDSDVESTRTSQRALTLRYAAPEQIAGDRTTTSTDVHALGVLLFELVAGASPFVRAGQGDVDWYRVILHEAPRSLSDAARPLRESLTRRQWQRLDGDLGRILHKSMAKSASARYASVASLDADLDDWLAKRPLRSGIGGAGAQTRYLLKRFRWPLTVCTAVLLALLLGAMVSLQQARRAQAQAYIARGHLNALLDLIGSANPGRFAGRDPSASEFLLAAAQRIQARHEADPALSRRALTEIGHGLLNLGHASSAESVLGSALEATIRDPQAQARDRLSVLSLLAQSQDDVTTAARLRQTVKQIEALALRPGLPGAAVADALARAGGALARVGDFEAAESALSRAEVLVLRDPAMDPGVVENFWRQRGWSALRALDVGRAEPALARALMLAASRPEVFSALRRAEGELLMAQAALLRDDDVTAASHLSASRAAYFAEYDAQHPERAAFELHEARVEHLRGNHRAARMTLDRIVPLLQTHAVAFARDLLQALVLQADLDVHRSDCGAAAISASRARAFAETSPALQPRERAALGELEQLMSQRCSGHSGKGDGGS